MTKAYTPAEHHARMVTMAGHPDEKEDRSLVKRMVKPAALTGRKSGGEAKRAMGGALPGAKHKGKAAPKSQTNILIAPRGGDRAGMPPASAGAAPGPAAMPSRPVAPVAPPRPPMGAVPPGGGGLGGLAGLGGGGPQGIKRGGKVAKRASGGEVGNFEKPKTMKGYDAGAMSGEGRLEKMAHYGTKAKTPLRKGGSVH